MNIDEEIAKLKQTRLELKIDLDDILDTINDINNKKKDLSKATTKQLNAVLALYRQLFYDYSNLFNNNESTLKKAEDLAVEIRERNPPSFD
jgi:predicted  nucleic acid-binding Zn-ribbon protein